MPLPDPIVVDLFDIEYKASRVALDHLADVIDSKGFQVTKIDDFDIKIWITFGSGMLEGTLIIDRMLRNFEIAASDDEVTYTAVATRDFSTIESFLGLLRKDLDDRLGKPQHQ